MQMSHEISPARILVVDDRPDNLMVMDALLESLGQPVLRARTGAEALKMLLAHDFAVILLDVQLPDFSGFEVAEMIKRREKSRHIPIIFITAISTDFDNIKLGYSTGAVDYISKPFNPDILKSKVSVFIDLYLKGEQIKQQAEQLRVSALRDAQRRQKAKEHALERRYHLELSAAYEREKRIADVLQRSLLLAPPEGAFPGISIATLYEAASDEANVGGDFFDAFRISPDKVALIIGDVTGKGLQAAARTAEVKYSLRAFLGEGADPKEALTRINPALTNQWKHEGGYAGAFVCVCILICDLAAGKVQCCCAGTEAPAIVKPDGAFEIIESEGMPLGIELGGPYELKECPIEPGDIIVMVTDGITEARSGKQFFGFERVLDTVRSRSRTGSVHDIAAALLKGAKDFAGDRLTDDACVVTAQFEGLPGQTRSTPKPEPSAVAN